VELNSEILSLYSDTHADIYTQFILPQLTLFYSKFLISDFKQCTPFGLNNAGHQLDQS